ncbi:MAG: ribonuclease HII [Alphaproteobacteria bacterium]|jgi:ribonuclease HII|tara:strand:+ start:216 stop:821 length:606 start_codon:yes stop_codon:yes gene_type:complete
MTKTLPNLDIEKSYKKNINGFICGIDEVGRGCLAGPVVAAAIILNFDQIPEGINDSKIISKIKREKIANNIKKYAVDISIGEATNQEIDEINILNASLLAMKRAFESLKEKTELALIDGIHSPNINCKTKSIIKGDTKSLSIAAASIIAKVHRDSLMHGLGLIYPKYNFKKNVGYGTKEHYKIIKSYGITNYHRKTFKLFK